MDESEGTLVMAGALAPGALASHAQAALWGGAGGNPGAYLEALLDLQEAGLLRKGAAGWVAPEVVPPKSFERCLSDRLARLKPAQRQALDWVAVLDGCDSAMLAKVSLVEVSKARAALGALRDSRWLAETGGGHFGFGSRYLRTRLYEELDPRVRTEMHLAIAEVLEGLVGRETSELASHFGQGHPKKAVPYLLWLGEEAYEWAAAEEAIAFFNESLDSLERMFSDDSGEQWLLCRERLGSLLAERDPGRAIALLAPAIEEVKKARSLVGRSKLGRLQPVVERIGRIELSQAMAEASMGHYPQALEAIERSGAATGRNATLRLRALALLARVELERGALDAALKLTAQGLRELEGLQAEGVTDLAGSEADFLLTQAVACGFRGDVAPAAAPSAEEASISSIAPERVADVMRFAFTGRWREAEVSAWSAAANESGAQGASWLALARAWALCDAGVPRLAQDALADLAQRPDALSQTAVELLRACEAAEA
ncbi:MAG: hypothetical protein KGR26_12650, partial [Cyanobacteria bacterium REEB65]|nr:hypothetical protein [Cyanobacteria bacterium REEB65]